MSFVNQFTTEICRHYRLHKPMGTNFCSCRMPTAWNRVLFPPFQRDAWVIGMVLPSSPFLSTHQKLCKSHPHFVNCNPPVGVVDMKPAVWAFPWLISPSLLVEYNQLYTIFHCCLSRNNNAEYYWFCLTSILLLIGVAFLPTSWIF